MYAILDVETTGGKYDEEGITEIAIYRFDGEKIIDQFISLINPEKEIQPFVIKLTGINNKMLRNSPKFYEVAKRIIEITENSILVAHNAGFDYRILQTEFRRLSFAFERKTLCTIKLSKILLPEQSSFSLGKLVSNLGIPFTNQHRANADAKATLKLFQLLLEKDSKKIILKKNIQNLTPNKIPSKYIEIIDKLPSEMGVYYIHNKKNEIIYIGKSNNIKKRVLGHLTGIKKKAQEIQKAIFHVTFALTGGELISLLKQQNEIKVNTPIYNRGMKIRLFPMGIRIDSLYEYPFKNFLLIDKGREKGEFSFVYIKNNKFLGYGYYELNHQIKTKDQIESRLILMNDNLDTQKLIRSFLSKKKYIKLIHLQNENFIV